jgi:hypothetical protein
MDMVMLSDLAKAAPLAFYSLIDATCRQDSSCLGLMSSMLCLPDFPLLQTHHPHYQLQQNQQQLQQQQQQEHLTWQLATAFVSAFASCTKASMCQLLRSCGPHQTKQQMQQDQVLEHLQGLLLWLHGQLQGLQEKQQLLGKAASMRGYLGRLGCWMGLADSKPAPADVLLLLLLWGARAVLAAGQSFVGGSAEAGPDEKIMEGSKAGVASTRSSSGKSGKHQQEDEKQVRAAAAAETYSSRQEERGNTPSIAAAATTSSIGGSMRGLIQPGSSSITPAGYPKEHLMKVQEVTEALQSLGVSPGAAAGPNFTRVVQLAWQMYVCVESWQAAACGDGGAKAPPAVTAARGGADSGHGSKAGWSVNESVGSLRAAGAASGGAGAGLGAGASGGAGAGVDVGASAPVSSREVQASLSAAVVAQLNLIGSKLATSTSMIHQQLQQELAQQAGDQKQGTALDSRSQQEQQQDRASPQHASPAGL